MEYLQALETREDEAQLLRDALDHIMRVARRGMQPTRRLDWIELRAKVALRGEKWEPGMRDEPRDTREKLWSDLRMYRARAEAAEKDALTLALRLYGELDNTFAPETLEVMNRYRPLILQMLNGDA